MGNRTTRFHPPPFDFSSIIFSTMEKIVFELVSFLWTKKRNLRVKWKRGRPLLKISQLINFFVTKILWLYWNLSELLKTTFFPLILGSWLLFLHWPTFGIGIAFWRQESYLTRNYYVSFVFVFHFESCVLLFATQCLFYF